MATRKTKDTDEVVIAPENVGSMIGTSLGGITINADADPQAIAERMAKRVRSSTTMDELFDSLTGKSSDQMVGRAFEFRSVTWQAFESERGTIPNAVCECVDLATGEETEFVTTGAMLVQFLFTAQQLNGFPFKARIVEKTTRNNQKALNFERV